MLSILFGSALGLLPVWFLLVTLNAKGAKKQKTLEIAKKQLFCVLCVFHFASFAFKFFPSMQMKSSPGE